MIKQTEIKIVGYGTFGGISIGTQFTPADKKQKFKKIYTKVSLTAATERTTLRTITMTKQKRIFILELPSF